MRDTATGIGWRRDRRKQRSISQRTVEALEAGQRVWDHQLPGFCVRCQGRSKTFGLQVRIHGKQRWLTIGKWGVFTPDEARLEARRLLGRIAAGEDLAARRDCMKGMPTINELAELFIAQHVQTKLKPRTAAEYVRLLRTCIKSADEQTASRLDRRGRPSRKLRDRPRLGDLRAPAVTEADVLRFHNALSNVPYEANRALAVLSKLMSFAEQQGVRPRGSNPCRGIAKFKEHRRERFLSLHEFAKLADVINAVETSGRMSPFVLAAIRVLILTGARREEIRTLRWEYIDVTRGMAFLPDSKTGKKILYLPPPVLYILSALPKMAGNPCVFPGVQGQPIRDLQGPWEALRTMAGMPQLRIHDLRHSYASLLAASGTPPLVIGKLLGHRHVTTTARYAHFADDPLRLASEHAGNQLANAISLPLGNGEVPRLANS
jgi:integrase